MDGGESNTVIDTSQTNVDPNTAVNPNTGSVDLKDYNPTTVSQWWDTQQAVGGVPDFSSFPFGQAANAILGGSGGGMGAGMALGLGALAAALSRQQAPETKQPEYKAAPIYNRALTAPLYPPQPTPQKSASGQNIYTPMRGMPLFFNPNPFQFDPTEAAKRYGPTPEQIAQGQKGYEAGLASLYKPLSIAPITFGSTASDTTTGTATGTTTGGTASGATSTTAGGTTGITSGDATVRPTTVSPAPLVPPPPAPSTSSTQTTQSSGATTQVPSTVSSNIVPEGYFRNPVQSSGSLSQIAGALNEGEFLPILKDADWYMTRDLEDVPKDLSRTWRDPVSGYGISVDPYRDVSAAAFTYYDPQGRKLRSSIFNPAELYKNAQEFGIDLSGISELGKKLDAAGVSYRPGELYAGSDQGINFDDIAAKKVNPPGGASGGSIDDILVGYDGGAIGYDEGGDVYAYAKGQYLQGDGDGMSDSIPATINNKQPARLADGEFVVPADVVSDLGNGSSNAGAQRLHKMMRDIRMARHKTTKQPPEVNVKKAMPA